MKNSKKLFILAILSGLILVGTQSCSQYPDNSGITFVSKITPR